MDKLTTLLGLLAVGAVGMLLMAEESRPADARQQAEKLMNDGNWREAYDLCRELALDEASDARKVGDDLNRAITCLQQLGRADEIDAFREQVVRAHEDEWRVLHAVARSYTDGVHFGYLVAGEFHRGDHRGGGNYATSFARDRVRALQLMRRAMDLVEGEEDKPAVAHFYLDLADILFQRTDGAWQYQALTDLEELPDYEQGYRYWGQNGDSERGAPVDADGEPVYYEVPESWESAASDGERWRWALAEAVRVLPAKENEALMRRADFLESQFGVQTVSLYGGFFGGLEYNRPSGEKDPEQRDSPFAVHTLGEEETIAKLASGVKRFTLPDGHNPIRLYQQVAASDGQHGAPEALEKLAQIFENRRQYPKAAEYWRELIERFYPNSASNHPPRQRLEQIVGEWGQFENASVQPAGERSTVEYRFRNGKKVTFEAHAVKVDKLLADVMAYIKSKPAELDWRKMNFENLGWLLVHENQAQYVGERVAHWEEKLEPPPNHFDGRITVETPLDEAGVYLLTAKMEDGNTSKIVLWVEDTAIARKRLGDGIWHFVADAVTGAPVPQATLEFFGWQHQHVGGNKFRVFTDSFTTTTDADGQSVPTQEQLKRDYQYLVIARTEEGRYAHLGFQGVWYGESHDQEYSQNKVFLITDRPVYRPEQTVKYKLWIRKASYAEDDLTDFAKETFKLRITDPRGNTALEKNVTTDEFGGVEGEYVLDDDAALGQYGLWIVDHPNVGGGGTFRVEEYKKPEFEVTVEAPSEPIRLGETITATIHARYYFGAPVTNAKVHYKVMRTEHTAQWFPAGRWDWFYGPGYWWFDVNRPWYPGWIHWGCFRPIPPWWQPHDPPELVLDNEVEIGADGTVKVEIDTAVAQAIHGDRNHRYEITAEVVDQSRRTIVGQGQVLVAKEPFQVTAWVHRGFYRTGDTVEASFKAQTLDNQPVQGKGELTLFRVTYDDKGKPEESAVEAWDDLDTDEQGEASVKLTAAEPGQYRLSYEVTDDAGHTIEGGYLFTVLGEGFDSDDYRYNDLELIVEKREYAPGEQCRILINADREDATVLLFVKPQNGTYPRPVVLRLDGKSTTWTVPVEQKDMPNFFIEAMTISGADLHTETREIVVPPEKRIVEIQVDPSQPEYLPGEEAKVRLKLTDLDGNPFAGSTVLTVYDKSVEYISGGTNVADIREHFWKWRRNHYPGTVTNLERYFGNLVPPGENGMSSLGVFGWIAQDQGRRLASQRDEGRLSNRKSAATRGGANLAVGGYGGGPAGPLAPAAADEFAAEDAAAMPADKEADGAAPAQMVEPTVRTNFADTAFWSGELTPDENGVVEVAFDAPENLTTWKIRTWAMGSGTRVGEAEAEIITTKNLLVRLQAPRFFTETDEVVLSAIVHNYLDRDKQAEVVLELDGGALEPLEDESTPVSQKKPGFWTTSRVVMVPADGEIRVDWRVRAVAPGEATVRMKALTDEESDAMEMTFPVLVHGILKTESFTGTVQPGDESALVDLTVPEERKQNESRLEVRFSPTLAGAMVDALPYLVSYPYGCTEQTLNRFLPTVITQNILKRMEIDLAAVRETRANLNAQEIGDPDVRAGQWQRFTEQNPVFDEAEVARMVADGIQKLTDMQSSDGGWGWFSGWGSHSDPHTTALVVHGLQIAQQNGVPFDADMLERGMAWLRNYQDQQVEWLRNHDQDKKDVPKKQHADALDAFVFMVLCDAGGVEQPGVSEDAGFLAMLDYLYRDRTHIPVYAKAMYGLALHKLGEADKLAMILRNIEQYLVQDAENETAYLKLPNENSWWYWYGDDIEANAYYLKLLSRTDAQGIIPRRLVKYILNNRKHATYWNSTRDTAIAIEALAEYMQASGEDRPNMTVEVWYDGQKRKEVEITPENLFTIDNSWVLEGDAVESGPHKLELRRKGDGPLYWNAYLTYFSLEDFITATGLEIKVERRYFKLIPQEKTVKVEGERGQAVDQKVEKYQRVPLETDAELTSGDLVEIELVIDSKNDYEHLMFEDHKGAGFEPAEVRSGYTSDGPGAYVEYRDETVNFFIRHLARGRHSLSYRLRAEVPGRFSALPTIGTGMYAPELRGNSDEIKLVIEDREE